MISGIQFYENGVPNIKQNRGNYAIVKQVPLQPSSLWGKNIGKIYSTWIFVNILISIPGSVLFFPHSPQLIEMIHFGVQ
jgi:hypothetical protein